MKSHTRILAILKVVTLEGVVLTGPAVCREFQMKGHVVAAICLYGLRKSPRLTFREAARNLIPSIREVNGVRYYLPPVVSLPLLQIISSYITCSLFSLLYFRSFRPDVVYSIDAQVCGALSRFIHAMKKCALFFDYGDPFWEHRRDITAKAWLLLERIALSYKGKTAVSCLYPAVLNYMKKRYPSLRSELAPRGYYPEDYLPSGPNVQENTKLAYGLQGSQVVLYGGSLDYRVYRPDVMLNAAEDLARRLPNVKIMIAGSGDWLRELQVRVSGSGLQHNIRVLGQVPREKFLQLVSAADVCVATYAGSPASKVYEYMASSKPVVMALGSREVRGFANGVNCVITPLDPELLSAGIYSILMDRQTAELLEKNGFEMVRNLTWEKVAEKRLQIIEEIVHSQDRK